MEPLASSNLHFLNLNGEDILAPDEWMPAFVEVQVDNWRETSLSCKPLGDLPLTERRLGANWRVVAEWPRANTGTYHLALRRDTHLISEQTVSIRPKKISYEAYLSMLEDLNQMLPASIALGLQQTGALADILLLSPGESTLAQELVRLRRALLGTSHRPGLVQALQALVHQPHHIFATQELWVPRKDARRPSPSRLVYAMARPGNIDAKKFPLNLLDTRVEHTFDTYENRLLKFSIQLVAFRLRRFLHILETMVDKSSSANLASILQEAQNLQANFTTAQRTAQFLTDVSLPTSAPTQITMVLLHHPIYHAILEGFLELQKNLAIRLEEPALQAPLENLPKLYQVWSTLRVLQALLNVAKDQGYLVTEQHLARRDRYGFYIQLLPDGQPIVRLTHPIHHTEIKMIPERTYPQAERAILRSTSHEQRPDIAIEVYPLNKAPRVYLFDPKYKLKSEGSNEKSPQPNVQPKKEDLDKMHVYRDAIHDQQENRVVQYAAILYPGSDHLYPDSGIAALRAYPEPNAVNQLHQHLYKILTDAL